MDPAQLAMWSRFVDGESLKDERSQLWRAAYSLLFEIERQAP